MVGGNKKGLGEEEKGSAKRMTNMEIRLEEYKRKEKGREKESRKKKGKNGKKGLVTRKMREIGGKDEEDRAEKRDEEYRRGKKT